VEREKKEEAKKKQAMCGGCGRGRFITDWERAVY
jgi:hypothetical protein